MRITITVLRDTIEQYNDYLYSDGILFQFIDRARNGYQGVDLVAINPDRTRVDTRVLHNVELGTSKECVNKIYQEYSALYRQFEKLRDRVIKRVKMSEATYGVNINSSRIPGMIVGANKTYNVISGGVSIGVVKTLGKATQLLVDRYDR